MSEDILLIYKDYVWDTNPQIFFPNLAKAVSMWTLRALLDLNEEEFNKLFDYSDYAYMDWEDTMPYLVYPDDPFNLSVDVDEFLPMFEGDYEYSETDYSRICDIAKKLVEQIIMSLHFPDIGYNYMLEEFKFPFLRGIADARERYFKLLKSGYKPADTRRSIDEFVAAHINL